VSPSPRTTTATIPALVLTLLVLAAPGAATGSERSFLVAAAGDISCPKEMTSAHHGEVERIEVPPSDMRCQGQRVADLILSAQPGIVLALGDLIQWQPSRTSAYEDFDLAWGRLGGRIMPTIGNHDYTLQPDGSSKPSGYFDFWQSRRTPRWKIGDRDRGWSSWNAGNWHMINLNSNCGRVDCTLSGPQMRWLVRDLKANHKSDGPKCLMAYFHHPRFSAGIPAGRTGDRSLLVNAWELLYRFRVDVVVTGHQHFYQRFRPMDPQGRPDPTGIRQFITGTGGASTFPIASDGDPPARNAEVAERRLGATFFRLGPDSYSWEFRSVRGVTVDRASRPVKCHRAGAGIDRRRPRLKRYVAHMKRVDGLLRQARRLERRWRVAKRRGWKRHWVRSLRRRLDRSIVRYDKARKRPLYASSARPGM